MRNQENGEGKGSAARAGRRAAVAAALLAAALVLCAGCFNLERAATANPGEEHVFVSNYGWYLFDFIPIACGNAAEDRWLPFVIFRNDVTMDKIQRAFMRSAERTGKTDMRDLTYRNDDTVLFMLPGVDFPIPIPYILTYREIQLSGTVKEPEKK